MQHLSLHAEYKNPAKKLNHYDKPQSYLMKALFLFPKILNIQIKTVYDLTKKALRLDIVDFGEGLNKEDIEKLFKRFSQGTSRKRSASTGLGLYLSRQIIEAHGGKIFAAGEPGLGCTFSFILNNSVIENQAVL